MDTRVFIIDMNLYVTDKPDVKSRERRDASRQKRDLYYYCQESICYELWQVGDRCFEIIWYEIYFFWCDEFGNCYEYYEYYEEMWEVPCPTIDPPTDEPLPEDDPGSGEWWNEPGMLDLYPRVPPNMS